MFCAFIFAVLLLKYCFPTCDQLERYCASDIVYSSQAAYNMLKKRTKSMCKSRVNESVILIVIVIIIIIIITDIMSVSHNLVIDIVFIIILVFSSTNNSSSVSSIEADIYVLLFIIVF